MPTASGPSGAVPAAVCLGLAMRILPFAEPAALAQFAQASAHAYLMPPTLAQAQRD